MFKCGDKVVCPPHGAALIEDIQEKWVFGEKRTYFILKPFYGQMTIMVPVDRTDDVGLRKVVEATRINDVLEVLKGDESDLPENWSHRFKENWGKLSTGDIMQVAEVVRDLSSLERRKNLSVKEKDMLSHARRILISELIFAQGVEEKEAIETIESFL